MIEILTILILILPAVGLLAFILSPKKEKPIKPIPKKEVLVDSLSMDILEATVEVTTEKRISPEEYAFLYNTVEVKEKEYEQD